jgi:HEAT repeat protein
MRLCSETEFPDHVLCDLLEKNFLQRRNSRRKKILEALAYRWHMSPKLMFMDDSNEDIRQVAVEALGSNSPWAPETLSAVIGRLDDSDWGVRQAAVKALGAIGRLDSDENMASRSEPPLWKHGDFPFLFVHLHSDAAASALCRIWARRSIQETFACYIRDGNICFEMPDGRKAFSSSTKDTQLLKHILRAAPLNSPILRLVYRNGSPFKD